MSGIHAQCYSRFIYPASLPVAGSKGAPVRTLPTLSKSIASFCRNFLPCAPPRHSLLPNHGFLIATRQKISNPANPLTTNEKTFSNRYFFGHFGVCIVLRASPLANRAACIRYSCALSGGPYGYSCIALDPPRCISSFANPQPPR
jgi:hypothetical protein